MTVAEQVQAKVKQDLFYDLCTTVTIPARRAAVLVRQAKRGFILTGRDVDSGAVRETLGKAGWSSAMIDFLIFRDPEDGSLEVQ